MELLVILLFIVFIILTIIISSVLSKKRTERDITIAEKRGEERTAYLLHSLPDNYKLIRNAVISHEGRESEIDNIVVGNTDLIFFYITPLFLSVFALMAAIILLSFNI